MSLSIVQAGSIDDFVTATSVTAVIGANQVAVYAVTVPNAKEDGNIRITWTPVPAKVYAMVSSKPPVVGDLMNYPNWKMSDLQVGSYRDMLPIAVKAPREIRLYVEANHEGVASSIEKDSFGHFILNAAHADTWYISVIADLEGTDQLTLSAQGKTQPVK